MTLRTTLNVGLDKDSADGNAQTLKYRFKIVERPGSLDQKWVLIVDIRAKVFRLNRCIFGRPKSYRDGLILEGESRRTEINVWYSDF